jgi:hypothetical protein
MHRRGGLELSGSNLRFLVYWSMTTLTTHLNLGKPGSFSQGPQVNLPGGKPDTLVNCVDGYSIPFFGTGMFSRFLGEETRREIC